MYTRVKVDGTGTPCIVFFFGPVLTYLLGTVSHVLWPRGNWVVFHPLYTLNNQVFFIAHMAFIGQLTKSNPLKLGRHPKYCKMKTNCSSNFVVSITLERLWMLVSAVLMTSLMSLCLDCLGHACSLLVSWSSATMSSMNSGMHIQMGHIRSDIGLHAIKILRLYHWYTINIDLLTIYHTPGL